MALTVKRVLRFKQRGKYPDGLGLYLQVNGNNRSWIFRYKQFGKQQLYLIGHHARDCHKNSGQITAALAAAA